MKKMKQTDKVRILNKQAWVDTITYLCPHRWDGACHAGAPPATNCTGHGTATGSCACTYVTNYLETYAKFAKGELEI